MVRKQTHFLKDVFQDIRSQAVQKVLRKEKGAQANVLAGKQVEYTV